MDYDPPYPARLDSGKLAEYRDRLGSALFEKRYSRQCLYWCILTEIRSQGFWRRYFRYRDDYLTLCIRCLGLMGWGRRNMLRVRLVENVVSIPHLPPAFEGFRLLQVSDPHFDIDPELPSAIERAVEGLQYDAVVLTGDYRNSRSLDFACSLDATSSLISKLKAPAYAIFGNHDFLEMGAIIEAAGARLLLNEAVSVVREGQRIWICGVDDPVWNQTHDFSAAARAIPEGETTILLAHSPCALAEATGHGFGYVLCGHTHGGQICLPGGVMLLRNSPGPTSVLRGSWRHLGLVGYTSSGAGSVGVPVRFNCPPEVVLHTLYRADSEHLNA